MCVTRTMSVDGWIHMSDGFDVDGLEFYAPFTPLDDPSELERIRREVERRNRAIPMMCYSPDYTRPDARERRLEVEAQKRALRGCAVLGVKYCRVLSGQRRPEVARDEGVRWAAECICELLPEAEKSGITLVLENHYKDGFWTWPEFAQKLDVFLQLLDAIPPHPSFGVNYDPSNAIIAGEDPIAVLEAVKHRVVTMHASDRYFEGGTLADLLRLEAHPVAGYAGILKHGVIGRGMNDYDRIFAILKAQGFAGWISIEDGMDPATGPRDIAESAHFLRRKMREHGLA
ncbi:MAG: sugar phosphate isomerase/epimerase family protein [Bryobacteraceae bacterium]